MAFRAMTVAAILVGWTFPAGAQQSVTLEFNAGEVTLSARNAPVRAILAEWARLGGATIVNGDRVAGPPVTLELTSVPERQALDVVLRGVAGYMIAARPAGSNGASAFDRVLILPTSAAPRNPPPAVVSGRQPGPPRTPVLLRPTARDNAPGAAQRSGAGESTGQAPAIVRPSPGVPRVVRPPIQTPADLNAADTDGVGQPNDDAGGVLPTPSNPFGIPAGSSATPGIVTPLPQGQQQPGPARVQ